MSSTKACGHCGRGSPQTLRCSRCKAVWYCHSVCQRAAWPHHRKQCAPPQPPPTSPTITPSPICHPSPISPKQLLDVSNHQSPRALKEQPASPVGPILRPNSETPLRPPHRHRTSPPSAGPQHQHVPSSTQAWLQAEATYERNRTHPAEDTEHTPPPPTPTPTPPSLFRKAPLASLATDEGAVALSRQLHFHGFAIVSLDASPHARAVQSGLEAAGHFFRDTPDAAKNALRTPSFQVQRTNPVITSCHEVGPPCARGG
eukprot:1185658-Prorocentrum_minimum.AAC.6